MHALSLGTWWIHVASVIEWSVAIVLIRRRGLNGPGLGDAAGLDQCHGRLHLAPL